MNKQRKIINTKLFIANLAFILILLSSNSFANVAIIGGLTNEHIAKPGETYQGNITLANLDEEPQEVRIYQTDYAFFADGKAIYGDPGSIARSNTSWITFSPSRLTIPPKGNSEVIYTVKVPLSMELIGTYWSMIMVEGLPNVTPEDIQDDKPKVGIKTVIRYGVQMVTHIRDTGIRKLKFLDTKLIKADNGKILQVDIENIGERMVRPLLWCEIYDTKGTLITRLEGRKLRTYPGTSVRYNVRAVIKRLRFSLSKQQIETINFGETMDKGVFPELLQKNFKDRLILIPADINVQVEETGSKWLIINDDEEYSITKSEDKLEIFQNYVVPSGVYKSLIIADCGNDYVFGAKYDLKVGE